MVGYLALCPDGRDDDVDVGEALLVDLHVDHLRERCADRVGYRGARVREELLAEAGLGRKAAQENVVDLCPGRVGMLPPSRTLGIPF